MFNIIHVVTLFIIYSLVSTDAAPDNSGQFSNRGQDSLVTATYMAVGDLMCHSTQFNYAKAGPDSFDFNGVYEAIKAVFDRADFLMGNLETTFAGKEAGYNGYPIFNTPDDFLNGLKYAGFDFVFAANNHSIDRGEKGIIRTSKLLNELGIGYTGINVSKAERDSVKIFDVNGIKTTVLSYTYSSNGMDPGGKDYLLSYIDPDRIGEDIKNSRDKGAELVIVYLHYGNEYQKEPSAYQIDVAAKVKEHGADIILGSHPHVMQPAEFYKSKASVLDSGFNAYSMGNFISNQRWRYSDAGVIVSFTIEKNKNTGKLSLKEASFMPTWVFKGSTKKGREYIILPAEMAVKDSIYPPYMTAKDIELMRESYYDTEKIMRNYFPGLKIFSPEYPGPVMVENIEINSDDLKTRGPDLLR